MVALRQTLIESLVKAVGTNHRAYAKQSTKHNHVEDLRVFHLCSLVHGSYTIHLDVGACRRIDNTKAVVDEYATRLNLAFKLVERRLV